MIFGACMRWRQLLLTFLALLLFQSEAVHASPEPPSAAFVSGVIEASRSDESISPTLYTVNP